MQTPTPDQIEDGRTLRSSRRLDWRFLFSDPTLDAVAYVGPSGSALLASLRSFSRSVDVLTESALTNDEHRGRYDVLIVAATSKAAWKHGHGVLKPGGWLYAEVRRRRPVALESAQSYANLARAAGFDDVTVQWHWPNFDSCTRMVPLDDPAPFEFLLARGRSDAAARVKATLGRSLVKSGLLGRFAPCFSIVGRLPRGVR